MTRTLIRTYSELVRLQTFEERFDYLRIGGVVGETTFGFDRYLNQEFYRSKEWRTARRDVIARDMGCDLGIEDHEIFGRILVHHMNPITLEDIEDRTDFLLNPEYLVTTCELTHNAIHFGDASLLPQPPVERRPNDTCPWRE